MSEDPATHPRARNRRGEGAKLRDEIVAAAAGLLDETGDDSAISLRSVARRAGIAAPSIYRHFPDQAAIMLAVTRSAFAELDDRLRADVAAAGEDPRSRLFAVCDGYLEFAAAHPGRYRTMFGGFWKPNLGESSVSEDDLATLGQASMELLAEALAACADAGLITSTDPSADAVALWLGLHGLAHQRAVSPAFRWPPDIAERLITKLTGLDCE
ncbi:TetR/AcrR family transcriptional regulator [Amycolatopsis saalfeldensis]|uniref:DNA-binding transcriptional regulator, AcrR family n=1 Tax=Amycolatopsis saalfeldensis TaxID=394193 RepID=A0A1H8Q7K4_9PSEU|nr:TetR/AcrR family transcriptional regulator [Amycolatopsis saalfeldensis]SEO50008.1 DNA-binding transcriptional regulator, AcrR family [Amycolatopsis saalfeldensis]